MRHAFPDGIYALHFRAYHSEPADSAEGLALLNGDQIKGAAPFGAVFYARLAEGDQDCLSFDGELSVPPHGELITGLRAGPEGLTLPLHAVTVPCAVKPHLRVEVAGQRLDVEVTYVGPLPSGLMQTSTGHDGDTTHSPRRNYRCSRHQG